MAVEVIIPGMLTTVQDLGRYGYQQSGMTCSGVRRTEKRIIWWETQRLQQFWNLRYMVAATGSRRIPSLHSQELIWGLR